jgi:hypothetical protein
MIKYVTMTVIDPNVATCKNNCCKVLQESWQSFLTKLTDMETKNHV